MRKRSTKHSKKRKTHHKRSAKYSKRSKRSKRSTHKKQRGGRDFQAGATREVIERVPITDKVTIATTDGWVGTAQSYKAHEEYLSNQLRVTGSG
jgi:hypothetical protein